MKELQYLSELVNNRDVIVPDNYVLPVRNAALALGLPVCAGAIIEDAGELRRVLYLG